MTNTNIQPKNYILQGPTIIRIDEKDIPYTYVSSDLHYSHKNILNFTNRGKIYNDIDEMNAGILENYQKQLEPLQDTRGEHTIRFIHCGDLIFGTKSQVNEKLSIIQNKIDPYVDEVYAVFGNHDIENILRYHEVIPAFGFNTLSANCNNKWFWNNVYVVEVYRETKCILRFTVSHFPMEEYYGAFNIHGHLHSQEDIHANMNNAEEVARYRATGHHFDCGLDFNNCKAVSLADILEGKTSINVPECCGKRQFIY